MILSLHSVTILIKQLSSIDFPLLSRLIIGNAISTGQNLCFNCLYGFQALFPFERQSGGQRSTGTLPQEPSRMKRDGFADQLNLGDSVSRQAPHLWVGSTQSLREKITSLHTMASPGARAARGGRWPPQDRKPEQARLCHSCQAAEAGRAEMQLPREGRADPSSWLSSQLCSVAKERTLDRVTN